MRVLLGFATVMVFALSSFFSAESVAAPNKSKLLNGPSDPGKKSFWVVKRHKNDPNRAGDVAAAFRVIDDPDPSAPDNALKGEIFLFDSVAGGKYVFRASYTVKGVPQGGNGGSAGEESRRRETCTFSDIANPNHKLFVSLGKGKKHTEANNKKVILRYKNFALLAPAPAKANGCEQANQAVAEADGDNCCDDVPNDDILEEESIIVDMTTELPILEP